MTEPANFLIGPFDDLRRFVVGATAKPPSTRIISEPEVATARGILSAAGCDLAHCTVINLHTDTSTLSPEQLFDLALAWRLWPRSSFFACPGADSQGTAWLTYRWYKLMPIVKMRLKTAIRPRYIIYDLVWGVGQGGYHSFLINQNGTAPTTFSICTTFAPTRLFMAGLHDQMNYDIFRQLLKIEDSIARGQTL